MKCPRCAADNPARPEQGRRRFMHLLAIPFPDIDPVALQIGPFLLQPMALLLVIVNLIL